MLPFSLVVLSGIGVAIYYAPIEAYYGGGILLLIIISGLAFSVGLDEMGKK